MREVILDTETTGLNPANHRIVEIGCVELENFVGTGRTFQTYVNPERPMTEDAFAVHGLDDKFLGDKPLFAAVARDFVDFIGDAPVIAHNAGFDMGFVDAELARAGLPPLKPTKVIDTVALARKKFPGAPASLDALCRRFGIDASERTLHGALLDASLLAEVYLELVGGRQPTFGLAPQATQAAADAAAPSHQWPPRPHAASQAELAAHTAFVATLTKPIWRR